MNIFEQSTLRQSFNRRLLALVLVFSVMVSIFILVEYQQQTDKFNRESLSNVVDHLGPRLKNIQRTFEYQSRHILNILEWSDLLAVKDEELNSKLQSFFTAQGDSMGVDGVVITSRDNDRVLFNYWNNFSHPHLKKAFMSDSSQWYDSELGVLYFINKSNLQAPKYGGLNIYFFMAWDNGLLGILAYPETTLYLSLGDKPMLSSAGNLSLETFKPPYIGYNKSTLNGIEYHQDSIVLNELTQDDVNKEKIILTVQEEIKNALPINMMVVMTLVVIVLFGAVLYLLVGQWLGRLGTRLDKVIQATLHYQVENINDAYHSLLKTAEDGKDDQVSKLAREMDRLMESTKLREQEQANYLQTLNLLQDAVIEITSDGQLTHATEAWGKMSGLEKGTQCNIRDCIHKEDVEDVLNQLGALTYEQKEQVNLRFRIFRQANADEHYWVEGRFTSVKGNDQAICIRGVVRDITNTYRQERQINYMALHDALTDLPNRILLEDRMAMAISRAGRNGKRVALGFIDLDHFKQVNDNFGHKVGDLMLKEVTAQLLGSLRQTDTLARWGGDEFVVLCPDLESLEDARGVTEKLTALTETNITIDGTEFPFIFSAGFAVYPDDAGNSEMLLSQADRAMFYAKAQGRNNIQLFNTLAAKEHGRESFYIQSKLSNAISNNEIEAWLQPLIEAKTGKVIGAEVLARWHEPEQGWIPPTVFIPMAESLGMIDRLGRSIWQQALHAFSLLPEDHRLSVNLSKRQLFSGTIVQQFFDEVAQAGISPMRIMLEITESIALSDVTYARERIDELVAKGFGVAIDDFGVGYSSLSQLHEIPAKELKLDISFVKRIHDKSGYSMAAAIISIAKSLNMECVAEGVEDAKTAELLNKMGVDILQGYYFAKPKPINEYITWLATR